MTTQDIRNIKDEWLIVLPIANVELTPIVNNELKVDRVTFVSPKKLPYLKRRYKLNDSISTLRKDIWSKEFMESNTCFAYMFTSGKINEIERKVYNVINEELTILSSSQLGFKRRMTYIAPRIKGFDNPSLQQILFLSKKEKRSFFNSSKADIYNILKLDGDWLRYMKRTYFLKALKLLRGEYKVIESWRTTLRRALILAGKSQSSRNISEAFLWNMIAMEMLITVQGDKYRDVLPERLESIIGWVGYWKHDHILQLYKKRCQYVHDGNPDNITARDLVFSDQLLFNLLYNIIYHHRIFSSKDHLIEFSQKVKAEKILGIKPKVQPKTLKYFQATYNKNDFDNITLSNN